MQVAMSLSGLNLFSLPSITFCKFPLPYFPGSQFLIELKRILSVPPTTILF